MLFQNGLNTEKFNLAICPFFLSTILCLAKIVTFVNYSALFNANAVGKICVIISINDNCCIFNLSCCVEEFIHECNFSS